MLTHPEKRIHKFLKSKKINRQIQIRQQTILLNKSELSSSPESTPAKTSSGPSAPAAATSTPTTMASP